MNVKLLRKVQKHILEEPRRIDMGLWGAAQSPVLGDDPRYVPACGTAGCIAGWAIILSQPPAARAKLLKHGREIESKAMEREERIEKTLGRNPARTAKALLKITPTMCDILFHEGRWPMPFAPDWLAAETPRQTAKRVAARIDHFIQTKGKE